VHDVLAPVYRYSLCVAVSLLLRFLPRILASGPISPKSTNQPINKSINLLTSGNVAHAEKNNTHTEKNSKSMEKVKKENEKHKGTHLNYKK